LPIYVPYRIFEEIENLNAAQLSKFIQVSQFLSRVYNTIYIGFN